MAINMQNGGRGIVASMLTGIITAAGMTAAGEPVGDIRPAPVIIIKNPPADARPVYVSDLKVNVRITGEIAQTSLDMTIANPNRRILEGECVLPLPEGAAVNNLALDINGKMIDASVVAKARAQDVFDTVTRQNVDPALAEHVGGNNYRVRVYPLPSKGVRRLRLQFAAPLARVNGVPMYILPMRYPEKLQCRLRIEVVDPAAAPQPSPETAASPFANLSFTSWERILVAEQTLNDIALTEDLRIAVAKVDNPPVFVEKHGEDYYFTAEAAAPAAGAAEDVFAAGLTLVWDASLSCKDHDRRAEFALLNALLAGRNLPVQVMFLRNTLESGPTVTIANGDTAPLIDVLEKTVYDGGTNFAALARLSQPKSAKEKDNPVLLFSDGMSNFGEKIQNAGQRKFFTVAAAAAADSAYLRFLAENSGGAYVYLPAAAPEDAAKKLSRPANTVVRVTAAGQEIPAVWSPAADGRWRLTGKLAAGVHALQVHFSGGAPAALNVDTAAAREGTLLRTMYGLGLAEKTQRLPGASPEDFLALGREYGIVTPGTSLLVLDDVQQYIQHKICPPASMPEWVDAYERAQNDAEKQGEKDKSARVKAVADRYAAEIMGWYNTKFTPKKPSIFRDLAARVFSAPARSENRHYSAPETGVAQANIDDGGVPVVEDEDMVLEEPIAEGNSMVREQAAEYAGRPGKGQPKRAAENTRSIKLSPWDPESPYLAALKAAPERAYALYLQYRDKNQNNVGFFTDCADYFLRAGDRAAALKILSNLAEMELENRFILRVLGYKLRFMGELAAAEWVFRQVLVLAPEEPQSYRDLALTLDDAGKFQDAASMMREVIVRTFDSRFPEIEFIAVTELNRILVRAERAGQTVSGIEPQLRFAVNPAIRVIINWDTDMSDMDLHTTDPYGEECLYSNRRTAAGGRNSPDFTQGYGPEEFMTRAALPGAYTVKTHYYGQRSQRMIGAVTLYAEIYTDYGTAEEKRETLSFRLAGQDSWVEVGKIRTDGIAPAADGTPPPPAVLRQYQIKANDTLTAIAERELGDIRRVAEILSANPQLKSEKDVRTGMIINLPRD